ncbi:unnamed protein product [Trichobilharzia regenti]|nr:unnamed protein product [Trichobilharzia regenti]
MIAVNSILVYFISAICFYPKDEGYGNDTMEKFYYHAVYGQCMTFTYYGNGGNDNNFDTKDVIAYCINPSF